MAGWGSQKSALPELTMPGCWCMHADKDPEFQQRCLTLMNEAADGEVAPDSDIAYLTDRCPGCGGQTAALWNPV